MHRILLFAVLGVIVAIALLALRPDRIKAVFLTHFHSDHIADLGNLALQRWVNGAHESPMSVYGPAGGGLSV